MFSTLSPRSRSLRLLAGLLLVLTGIGSAAAHSPRTRIGVGVYLGPPLYAPPYYPWYYPPPVVYQPPVVVVRPEAPPVYVEQAPAAPVVAPAPAPAVPPVQSYWYYCPSSKAYYPHVPSCPEEWLRVLPREH